LSAKISHFFSRELSGEQPPSFATMQALYSLSAQVFSRQPWNRLDDDQLVVIEGAPPAEPCFCCVLGALGEVFALQVYPGLEGFRQFKRIQSGDPITVGEFFAAARIVYVEFVRARELTAPDRALLKQMRHPLAARARAPIFRSIRPGYHPWYVTEAEAALLAMCARGLLAFLDVLQDDPAADFWPTEDVYPLLTPVGEKETGPRYKLGSVRAVLPPLAAPEPAALDEARIRRIRDRQHPSQEPIEVDLFYSAGMVGRKNQRKACMRVALAINANTAFAYPPLALSPEAPSGSALADVVLDAIESAGALPAEIHVRSREFQALLDPLARALGFSVKVRNSLPALDFAKNELFQMMGDPGPFLGED
jgi:Domain of unknown function (DUF6930)